MVQILDELTVISIEKIGYFAVSMKLAPYKRYKQLDGGSWTVKK